MTNSPKSGADAPDPTVSSGSSPAQGVDDSQQVPASFDEFDLPANLRVALAKAGWSQPTPVQAHSFRPLCAGKDVLVQAQTGTGKTGAFLIPWLASQFLAQPAKESGVQLLVLVPTRELAKQVCEELERLAEGHGVIALRVYGGTAMRPQLLALKAGVHAVVGTPGRILDHIRRRSLDLSTVRTVVLDEADEMLSMGFLEDIHAILDACPKERQTCLFSATVPPDIERIARRYMRQAVPIRLSGDDDVAAKEIAHTYYSVSGTIRTRDLLDIINFEEPTTALIFCNTREETNLVAAVLRREGYPAQALSSDLSQSAREKVLGLMRSGRLRFLVATDVASRGIDISHISHVINYTFPENAESYIHRTGRTGRAGRAGQAISLIAPQELGNFYYLKLQYPKLSFEERHLPPKEELQAQREETKLDHISKLFPELVSPDWTLLARSLMSDPRGEQVISYLLSQALTTAEHAAKAPLEDLLESDPELDDGDRGWRRPGRERRRGRERHGNRTRESREHREDRPTPRSTPSAPLAASGEHDEHTEHVRESFESGESRDRSYQEQHEGARHEGSRYEGPQRNRRNRRQRGAPEEFRDSGETDQLEATEAQPTVDVGVRDDNDSTPEGRRRRRRRRRGNRDRDDGPTHEPLAVAELEEQTEHDEGMLADTVDAIPNALVADVGHESSVAIEDTQPEEMAPDAEVVAASGPMQQAELVVDDGMSVRPPRRRRRRRRRRRGGPEETQVRADQKTSAPAETASADADDDGRGRSNRRRRRRKRRVRTEEGEVRVRQDEIVIDIDESELDIVRDEFGEINELDDLTLKGRRRGVMDALQDEVELEYVADADQATAPAAASEAATQDAARSGDAIPGEAERVHPQDTEAEAEDDEDDGAEATSTDWDAIRDKRRRKRRRRRKKKVEIPEPELTAPPHKDFWEVWASHFNYQQFEDDKLVEIPANELDEDTDARPPASAAPLPPRPTPGEPDIVLRLNVGRKHGKKAADIRGLLADHVHLEGRAVRGLTVGEASTRFRVAASQQAHVVAALHGFAFEDIELQIAVVEGDGVAGGTAPALSGPGDAADESDETADILAANEESGSSVAAEASAKPRKARSRSKAAAPTTEASTAEYEIEIETTDGASGSESTPLS